MLHVERMKRRLAAVLMCVALCPAAPAFADGVDPDDPDALVVPGAQPTAPGPNRDPLGPPRAIPRDDDRAPLRGVPIARPEDDDSDAAAMRAFEEKAFGHPDRP